MDDIMISSLPEDVRELAMRRRAENPFDNPDEDRLCYAFCWEDTPEGHDYWNEIDEGMEAILPPTAHLPTGVHLHGEYEDGEQDDQIVT